MKINNLIARFLVNKTTKEEWDTLETWKQESQENLNELLDMQSIWQDSVDLKGYKEFNKASAWEAISNDLEEAPKQKSNTKILNMKWAAGIAAAISIIFIALIGIFPDVPNGYNRISAIDVIENITLPDGSSIYMNKNSDLDYADDFTNNRDIILKGEAYFDVARDESSPFKITTSHADVTVLGTSFNILDKEGYVDVYVTSGKVKVVSGSDEVILTKGDLVRCKNGEISEIDLPSRNYLSWKTNKLEFNDSPLHKVVRDLNRHYPQTITFSGESKAMNQLVSDEFDNEDFESVLETLVLITGIKYHKEDNKYVIE